MRDRPEHDCRRRFGAVAFACLAALAYSGAADAVVFKHIVVIIQENRTPDNIFGSNPSFEAGVDIATSGVDSKGATIPLTAAPLGSCWDLLHTHKAFELSLTRGADKDAVGQHKGGCIVPPHPQFTYIDNSRGQAQPYFDIASNYGFANRMFQTNQGPSFVAHQFLFGGTSAPTTESPLFASENPGNLRLPGKVDAGCLAPDDTTVPVIDGYGSESSHSPIYPCFEHPTLTDRLDAHKPAISWRYYAPMPGSIWTAPDAIRHICQPVMGAKHYNCTGPAWTNGSVVPNNSAQVLTDVADCKLQGVSWVIPTSLESDHPQINNGSGPQWVASVVNAIGSHAACPNGETYWRDTAIIVTWDDWGGFYDHVKPFEVNVQGTAPSSQPKWGDGYTYGFRVPMMVVSAYTPAHYVNNEKHDFGSVLLFIERNFHVGFIGPGDTIYSQYADYQAQARGDLANFFSLTVPRPFKSIVTTMRPVDFLNQKPTGIGPDDY